ncbi:MAG TPA: glycine cleavage system protein GcvH [Candidatus Bathyarchaeota archaeon]|nr:glycine cleavage system protein GcvH [Candidatus Bathyarchaeota archaeon]HEW89720.1 glycine cleavage system protein GcvH [Candidatus Bathyarchaeota archaeon]
MVKVDDYEVKEGLYYSKDYLWVEVEDGKAKIGITDYAQKQLRDILYTELPEPGEDVTKGEPFGTVESAKTVSDLIAPLTGVVEEVNSAVLDNPGLINEDPYGEGWLIVITPTKLDEELKELMDFEAAVKWHEELVKG